MIHITLDIECKRLQGLISGHYKNIPGEVDTARLFFWSLSLDYFRRREQLAQKCDELGVEWRVS